MAQDRLVARPLNLARQCPACEAVDAVHGLLGDPVALPRGGERFRVRDRQDSECSRPTIRPEVGFVNVAGNLGVGADVLACGCASPGIVGRCSRGRRRISTRRLGSE